MNKEFQKYAVLEHGISSMTMHRYQSVMDGYINPTIIEERKLNVASMDVFSRLMMDRIIFLGVPIDDDVANIIQAQLLFLASTDSASDISLYINTPGGQVSSGLGIYDTMQIIEPDVATICTGMAASMGSVLLCAGAEGKRSALKHSRVMIHQPLGGARGQASDILIAAQEIEKTKKELYTIMAEIKEEAETDTVEVHHNIAVVAAVGRKMAYRPGISGKLFAALGESGINIRMINQGPDELNIIFGVANKDFEQAIKVLYNSFVTK